MLDSYMGKINYLNSKIGLVYNLYPL
jgi:hypothetical protein